MEQIFNTGDQLLAGLWDSLQQRAFPPRLNTVEKFFKKFATSGWAFANDLEDVLDALDSRLAFRRREVLSLVSLLDIKWEMICFPPRSRENNTSFFEAIRVEEAAYVLMILERLGFMTFPDRLVDLILPSLKVRKPKMLTNYELEVMRYHALRHKNQMIRLIQGARTEPSRGNIENCKSISGYNIEVIFDAEGRVAMLTAIAPKYRHKMPAAVVTCPECGYLYEKGDRDATYQHRLAHKKVMYYLNPEPNARVIAEITNTPNPELVRFDSPKWKHKEMFLRARAFNREMGYEAIMWGADGDDDPHVHGYLFSDASARIVGACSFRNRAELGCSEIWALQWVWVCPMERRNGHLSIRWEAFRERFKDFYVEHPVSEEMETFLVKHGEQHLMTWPYDRDRPVS